MDRGGAGESVRLHVLVASRPSNVSEKKAAGETVDLLPFAPWVEMSMRNFIPGHAAAFAFLLWWGWSASCRNGLMTANPG